MRLVQLISMLLVVAAGAVAQADPLRNPSQFGVAMRAGPGQQFPLIHVLDPGEVADRGRCDLGGAWCLLTAGRKIGWVDLSSVVAPAGGSVSDLARSDPIRPLRTAPVESTTLAPTAARPLPGAITEAVRGATDGATDGGGTAITPPGARVPFMFATDAPFYNVTEGLVNLRAGPGTGLPHPGRIAARAGRHDRHLRCGATLVPYARRGRAGGLDEDDAGGVATDRRPAARPRRRRRALTRDGVGRRARKPCDRRPRWN